MRITFINSANHKVSSTLTEENVFIQSGLLSDSPQSEYKKKPFELSRWDYTIKGDGIGLHELNEQLFYQCMKKIQDKVSLEDFFGVPDDSSDEPNAPDPAEGWHNNTGGELVD